MRSLFVMDPPDRLDLAGDSTYAVMCEANLRGHEVYWCLPRDLFALDGDAYARATGRVVLRGMIFSAEDELEEQPKPARVEAVAADDKDAAAGRPHLKIVK